MIDLMFMMRMFYNGFMDSVWVYSVFVCIDIGGRGGDW